MREERPDRFQTQSRIRDLLAQAGISPRRRFGQHFLIDRNLMMRLVDSGELGPADTVIEVGTGTGSLTSLLAERAGAVHTFEIDAALAPIAAAQLASFENVHLHRRDALENQSTPAAELCSLLDARGPVKLVANLPYDIATPLIVALLLAPRPPERLCITIQREVGDRLTAPPGTRDYGPAGVIAQSAARIERLGVLPPSAFWPPPKVESVMMRLTPQGCGPENVEDRRRVAEVVRRVFLHRRKTMGHILAQWLGADESKAILSELNILAKARPETIAPEGWRRLAVRIDSCGAPAESDHGRDLAARSSSSRPGRP